MGSPEITLPPPPLGLIDPMAKKKLPPPPKGLIELPPPPKGLLEVTDQDSASPAPTARPESSPVGAGTPVPIDTGFLKNGSLAPETGDIRGSGLGPQRGAPGLDPKIRDEFRPDLNDPKMQEAIQAITLADKGFMDRGAVRRVIQQAAHGLYETAAKPYAQLLNYLATQAGIESETLNTLAAEALHQPPESNAEAAIGGVAHAGGAVAGFFTPGGAVAKGAKLAGKAVPKIAGGVGKFIGGITGAGAASAIPAALQGDVEGKTTDMASLAKELALAPVSLFKGIKDLPGDALHLIQNKDKMTPQEIQESLASMTETGLIALMIGVGARRGASKDRQAMRVPQRVSVERVERRFPELAPDKAPVKPKAKALPAPKTKAKPIRVEVKVDPSIAEKTIIEADAPIKGIDQPTKANEPFKVGESVFAGEKPGEVVLVKPGPRGSQIVTVKSGAKETDYLSKSVQRVQDFEDAVETENIKKLSRIDNKVAELVPDRIRGGTGRENPRSVVYKALGFEGPSESVKGSQTRDDYLVRIGLNRMQGSKAVDLKSKEVHKELSEALLRRELRGKGQDPDAVMGSGSGLTPKGQRDLAKKHSEKATQILESLQGELSARPDAPLSKAPEKKTAPVVPVKAERAASPKAPEKTTKQPHEMTRIEFFIEAFRGQDIDTPTTRARAVLPHKGLVEKALASGKTVPPEVLKDYPDLRAKIESPKKPSKSKLAPHSDFKPRTQPEAKPDALKLTKKTENSIDRAMQAIDTINGSKIKKPNFEKALASIRTHADKLGIKVGGVGTYFSAEKYRQIAGDVMVAIGKKYGSNPTEKMRAAKKQAEGGFETLPQKTRDVFDQYMKTGDPVNLPNILHPRNKVLRAEFQKRTGIKLDRTQKRMRQQVLEWSRTKSRAIEAAKETPSAKTPESKSKAASVKAVGERVKIDRPVDFTEEAPKKASKTPKLDAIEAKAKADFIEAARDFGGGTVFSGPLPPQTVKMVVAASKIAAVKIARGGIKVVAAVKAALKDLGVDSKRVSGDTFNEIVRRSGEIVKRSGPKREKLSEAMASVESEFRKEAEGQIDNLPRDASVKQAFGFMSRLKKRLKIASLSDESSVFVFDADTPASKPLLEKVTNLLKEAKPIRASAEYIHEVERSKRAKKIKRAFSEKTGKKAAFAGAAALKGQFPTPTFEAISGKLSAVEVDALLDHIRTHRASMSPQERAGLQLKLLQVIDHGVLPTQGELAAFENLLGPRFVKALVDKIDLSKRMMGILGEVMNTPRTAITAYDLSAFGRQGFDLVMPHPRLGGRALVSSMRAWANEDYAVRVNQAMRSGSGGKLALQSGLELTEFGSKFTGFTAKEEDFRTNIFQHLAKIKITSFGETLIVPRLLKLHGMGIVASERSHVTMLNVLRRTVFDTWANELKAQGHNPNTKKGSKAFKRLALFINAATGREKAGPFKGAWWSTILFAPRFLTSRFTALFRNLQLAALGPAPLRRLAARQALTVGGAWLGMAAFVTLAAKTWDVDMEFELDPRSPDFLKMRIGDTRVDFGAGHGQALRLMAQVWTGQRKAPTGKIVDSDVVGAVGRFARFKLAPVPSAGASVFTGKTPDQKEPTAANIAKGLAVPITFQNIPEIMAEHGAKGLALMVPEVLGLGVAVHDFDPSQFDDFKKGDSRTKIYNRLWLTMDRGDDEGLMEAAETLGKTGVLYENVKASANRREIKISFQDRQIILSGLKRKYKRTE